MTKTQAMTNHECVTSLPLPIYLVCLYVCLFIDSFVDFVLRPLVGFIRFAATVIVIV